MNFLGLCMPERGGRGGGGGGRRGGGKGSEQVTDNTMGNNPIIYPAKISPLSLSPSLSLCIQPPSTPHNTPAHACSYMAL